MSPKKFHSAQILLLKVSCGEPCMVPSLTNISANDICFEETLFKSQGNYYYKHLTPITTELYSPVLLSCFKFCFAGLHSNTCQNSCLQRHIQLPSPYHRAQQNGMSSLQRKHSTRPNQKCAFQFLTESVY